MREMRNRPTYDIVIENLKGLRSRLRPIWQDVLKLIMNIGIDVDWVRLAQGSVLRWDFRNAVNRVRGTS
jgi:hypothetical protein